jgi:outer membrane protein assembly factor BamE (lipoprotein component of BamABCDE complex)
MINRGGVKMVIKYCCAILCVILISGCSSAAYHAKQINRAEQYDKLTVGKVQREIRLGMPSSQVIEILGSPNVVTTDENRCEVWAYDKIASEVVYSNERGGAWLIIGFVAPESGAARTSQKTLTIVIKFDANGKVRDFAYHSSSF